MNAPDPRFRLSPTQAFALAAEFGTPLYVVDENAFKARIQQYQTALKDAWPNSGISFASKANSTLSLLKIAYQAGTTIDVASEGELRAAIRAGVPPTACHLHGNNKRRDEIELALQMGVSQIIIDNDFEIDTIADILQNKNPNTQFLLRVAPGVDPQTHARISTGQADTKFGFNLADGSAEKALIKAIHQHLEIEGIHCHVGSQLLTPEAQENAGELLARFVVEMREKYGLTLSQINVGGGLAAKYLDDDHPTPIPDYCQAVIARMAPILAVANLNPYITMEPGRSLIAEAGVTLYEVGAVKTVPAKDGQRTYVSVDGGLSDNPRPAMYEAQYQVELIRQSAWEYSTDGPGATSFGPGPEDQITATICGRHCETDNLFEDVNLPTLPQRGDLIQVLTTGAYNSSMASNYNRFTRPASVLIRENQQPALIQRRETYDEMFAREEVI